MMCAKFESAPPRSFADERPGLVVLTIGLEEALHKLPGPASPSKKWSPYRAPLTR